MRHLWLLTVQEGKKPFHAKYVNTAVLKYLAWNIYDYNWSQKSHMLQLFMKEKKNIQKSHLWLQLFS